ncbi:MAG: thermonuclease family protein [Dehalococcoidia bacterium]|nr:thermonuclease family protein [Dehalococcoidia bacterium]
MRMLILSILLCSSCKAYSDDFADVSVVRNYDGDTFTVDLQGLPPVFGEQISVRVRGLDTPEVHASRMCERTAAYAAKKFLERALKDVKVQLLNCQRDKYFRLLCTVKAGEVDVTESLLKNGLAVVYNGETKKKWVCSKKQTPVLESPPALEVVP